MDATTTATVKAANCLTEEMAARGTWDGRQLPYAPGPEVPISSDLRLHDEGSDDIDPITFEVIRNSLWVINEEHADTIKRTSGSPVVLFAEDFNTSIQTETGEPVLFAPYIQYFTGVADLVTQWTMEHRSFNPGINDGDIFFQNDPLVGVSHQMDVQTFGPVFVDDRLFCWLFSSVHLRDIGGVEPGSFCPQATNAYMESTPVPPVKLVEGGVMRDDVEEMILRKSRTPDLIALDLRSQVAGFNAARQRVLELVGRYGAGVVKGVMRKIVADTEEGVGTRLAALPDGTWRDVAWVGCAYTGDREVHKLALTMTKEGDRLRFSNEGTDAQIGSANGAYAVWRAGINSTVASMLAWDHRFCAGGVARRVTYDAVPGTMSCHDREAACSTIVPQLYTCYQSAKLVSKMLSTDPELKRRAMSAGSPTTSAWTGHSGIDQYGSPYASVTLDEVAGGLGAFSFRDGVDQGGGHFWPKSEGPDIEAWEQYYPVLYLYRRSFNGFGHGRYRGGAGLTLCWKGHGTDVQAVSAVNVAVKTPMQHGLWGGHWGQTGVFHAKQDCGVGDMLAATRIPASPDELREAVAPDPVQAKTVGVRLGEDDVWEMSVYGGGGYGDPVRRDPEQVLADVDDDAVTVELARDVYGVVIADGAVDVAATDARRTELRAERLQRAQAPAQPADGTAADGETGELGDGLLVVRAGGTGTICCAECRQNLAPVTGNYKLGAACLSMDLGEIDPEAFPEIDELDDAMEYRMYLCPGCGLSLDNEISRPGLEPVWDVELAG